MTPSANTVRTISNDLPVLCATESMDELAQSWNQLLHSIEGGAVWLSPAWRSIWWKHFGGRRKLRVFAVQTSPDESRRLLAMAPLYRSRHKGIRRMAFLGGESQRHSLLCQPNDRPMVLAAFACALARRRDWDQLDLNALPVEEATALQAAFRARRLTAHLRGVRRQWYLRLDQPWPMVLTGLKRSLVKNVNRCQRLLQEAGALALETYTDPAEVLARIDSCLRIEASGWKGERGTAIICRPAAAAFYHDLAEYYAHAGMFRLVMLRCAGNLVAFEFCVQSNGVLATLKSGYDHAWARYSPGSVLDMMVLREAHAQGLREIDLLGGDEPYKANWTPLFRELGDLRVYNHTVRGRALELGRAVRHRVRRQQPEATPTAVQAD